MHDPLIDEAVRARELRPEVFRRLQRHLRDVVDPQLGERLALLVEVDALKAQIEDLKAPRKRSAA